MRHQKESPYHQMNPHEMSLLLVQGRRSLQCQVKLKARKSSLMQLLLQLLEGQQPGCEAQFRKVGNAVSVNGERHIAW
jgi:hypothetical protein